MTSATSAKLFLVLPAAGAGRRMQLAVPKQYQVVLDKPLLQHTLERIGTYAAFAGIFVALAPDDACWPAVLAALPPGLGRSITRVAGGRERADSVANALEAMAPLAADDDWVLVHDAVRPCVSIADIQSLITSLEHHPVGGILATPLRETLKRCDAYGAIVATVAREQLWQAATPQMFRYGILRKALVMAQAADCNITDESSAVEHWLQQSANPHAVQVVKGSAANLKVTYPEDLQLAAMILRED